MIHGKYKPVITDMFEFIRNKTTAGFSVDSITDQVMQRFPSQVAFYKCDKEMVRVFIYQLCEFARFMYTNKLK
jgi:hypothetical protein